MVVVLRAASKSSLQNRSKLSGPCHHRWMADVVQRHGFALVEAASFAERSGASPALASSRGDLVLAWTGKGGRINVRSCVADALDEGWGPGTQGSLAGTHLLDLGAVHATSPALGPCLAVTVRGMHLGWRGTDGRVNVARLGLGPGGPVGHVVLSDRSAVAPTLAAGDVGIELWVAWTGTDRHVNVRETRSDGFGVGRRWEHTSAHSPAVASYEDRVVLAWTGTDRHLNVADIRGTHAGRTARLQSTSYYGPALCVLGDEILLAWADTDGRINVQTLSADGRPGASTTFEVSTPHCPALAVHRRKAHLAWTGTDGRLNVARLERTAQPGLVGPAPDDSAGDPARNAQ
jgi:hypothetical protein